MSFLFRLFNFDAAPTSSLELKMALNSLFICVTSESFCNKLAGDKDLRDSSLFNRRPSEVLRNRNSVSPATGTTSSSNKRPSLNNIQLKILEHRGATEVHNPA